MKRAISLILALVLLCALLPGRPVFAQERGAQQEQTRDAEIPDVTDYSYTITPILSPFTYFLYVKTDNPDPTSFRLVDKNSKFYSEGDHGTVREYFEYGFSSREVDPGTYYIARHLYGDVVFENESTYRVPGGYIFYAHEAYSDGGEFVLLQKTANGASLTGDKFKETDITIPCPKLYTTVDYLIQTCTSEEMDLFANLDAVQSFLEQTAVYPRPVYDMEKPSEDYPYPLLAASPYPELGLNDHYNMFESMDGGILVSEAFPFVLDSASFPSTMRRVAQTLEPSCTVEWGDVHWLIKVTFQGKTKSYGGAGEGGYEPLYSEDVQKVFTFQGAEDYGTHGTIEAYRTLLRSYEAPAQEDAAKYQDLIMGDTFKKTIRESGGTWIRIGVEGYLGFGTSFGYMVPIGKKTMVMTNAWVDGRYIGQYERVALGATFEDHPTADIVLHDVTFTDRDGNTYTQDVCYEYDSQKDRWDAKWFYTGDFYFSTSWELPEELILSREEVEAMDLDYNTNRWPTEGLVYDGREYPGTPFTLKSATSITVPETLEVYIGKQVRIPTTVEPEDVFDDYVIWTSSDPEVVEVLSSDDNLIRGLKVGTATLTAVTRDGGYSDSCVVTVLPDPCENGHTWDEGTVWFEPSCYCEGTMLYHCIYCDEEKTEYIPTTEHSYSATVIAPNCCVFGYTRYDCTVCGDWYEGDYVDPSGHTWDEGVVTDPFDDGTVGLMTYTCIVCGETKEEFVYPDWNDDEDPDEKPDEEGYCPSSAFWDVDVSQWYHEGIDFALSHDLMNGMGGNRFEPGTQMSRAMLVTVLWRYAGMPLEGTNTFSDIEDSQWYTQAVSWAAHNGVVTGVGNGKFDPNGTMTREQLATVLYRYSKSLGMDVSKGADLGGFPDGNKVSPWAKEALSWAVAEGLVTGSRVGNSIYLEPLGSATRAQVATILMRYIENTKSTN